MAYCLGVENPSRHIMLDLETMGLSPRAAIVQIGACTLAVRLDCILESVVEEKMEADDAR